MYVSFFCFFRSFFSFFFFVIGKERERGSELSSSELQHAVAEPNDTPSDARLCQRRMRGHAFLGPSSLSLSLSLFHDLPISISKLVLAVRRKTSPSELFSLCGPFPTCPPDGIFGAKDPATARSCFDQCRLEYYNTKLLPYRIESGATTSTAVIFLHHYTRYLIWNPCRRRRRRGGREGKREREQRAP